jgi:hypothetical protein
MSTALRIGFFLDGFTLKKVNDYYRNFHDIRSHLDFRGLKTWVKREALKQFEGGYREVEMESHYYHPFPNPHIYGRDVDGTFKLEHELQAAGFHVHYNNHGVVGDVLGPNLGLIEDALLLASYSKMDAAVLFSTQGQFAPLPDRLRAMGVPTMLLGWEFVYPKAKRNVYWKTDTCLRATCARYVAMEKVVEENSKQPVRPKGWLFQKFHPYGRKPAWY